MLLRKRSFGILSLLGLTLVGCETTNPDETLMITAPVSSLRKNKAIQPQIAKAFILLKEGKYSEASTFINQTLQSQPKSVVLHILNGLTYEKLAEQGDPTGIELAIVGYQNAINLDPFNSFAITQLGKVRYRDQQFDQAQEHFANALLIKPNDPDLIHEFAAASYYAYDIKSAIAAIRKAEKLKPDDPLIQRSAAMMYAAVGDFKTAEKHFNIFQAKLGNDPEVAHVAGRFNDWQSLYKSGRLILAADQSNSQNSDSTSKDSGSKSSGSGSSDSTTKDSGNKDSTTKDSSSKDSLTSDTTSKDSGSKDSSSSDSTTKDSGSKDSTSKDSGSKDSSTSDTTSKDSGSKDTSSKDGGGTSSGGSDSTNKDSGGLTVDEPFPSESETATKEEFTRGDIGQNILDVPVASSLPEGPESPTSKQIIVDCYILQITETAATAKGHNILDTLAVTLNPGSLIKFKGSMWGTGVTPATIANNDKVSYDPDSAFGTFFDSTGKKVNDFQAATGNIALNNSGSITGRIFTAGITWAGLSYSLNIANAADNRTEIVSRPTLMTYLNKESKFFSGTELVNVSGGNYGSNLSRYPVGVSLGIKPDSLVGDMVTLSLSVESSLLQNPDPNLLATVDVSKTRVDTTARLRLGETIMLGGIYDRSEVDIQHGVPGLRDIPIIQYFFSEQATRSDRRSIVILLTPRSPDTVKSAVNRAMTRESVRPHLSELTSRNPDWFNPEVNAINILSYINLDPILYYEFRTGDVLPPSWGYDVILNDKLAELSSFLYY